MSKTVEFLCPHCGAENTLEVVQTGGAPECVSCGETIAMHPAGALRRGKVDECCICGGYRFYTQKDFNPRIGLLIFVIGVIFSYHTYGITLFVASAIDFVLYQVLPTVIVCYNCRAIYRGLQGGGNFKPYDPGVAMKYVRVKQPREAVVGGADEGAS